MMQLPSVVARLVNDFDVAFAPNEDGAAVWQDLKDQFNSHPGKLELVFVPRGSMLAVGEVKTRTAKERK